MPHVDLWSLYAGAQFAHVHAHIPTHTHEYINITRELLSMYSANIFDYLL